MPQQVVFLTSTMPPKVRSDKTKMVLDAFQSHLNFDLSHYMVEYEGQTEDTFTEDGMVQLIKHMKLSKKEERRMISKLKYNEAFQKELGMFTAMVENPPEPPPEPGEEEHYRKLFHELVKIGFINAKTKIDSCSDGKPLPEKTEHAFTVKGKTFLDMEGMNALTHKLDIPRWRLAIWVEEYEACKAKIERYKEIHLKRFEARRACFVARIQEGEVGPWESMIALIDASMEKIRAVS